ncbi:MAG: HIT family protein [Pseudomonadales bacterium]
MSQRTMHPEFTLHPQLEQDTCVVMELAVCRVLLMNDARYPWLILVPRFAGVREIYDLPADTQDVIWREVGHCGSRLMDLVKADKLNIGALGNLVPQLHIHVIARRQDDDAWPAPVWGRGEARPYTAPARQKRLEALRLILAR